MSSFLCFTTRRFFVRRIDMGDLDAMCAVYGNAEAMIWVDDGLPLDRKGCEHWIHVTQENYALRGYGMSAILSRESGAVIGFCGLVHPGGQVEPEIKYALLQSHWGQGIATEVVLGMLEYGAESFGLTEIIATVDAENLASRRVLEKAGMLQTNAYLEDDGAEVLVLTWRAGSLPGNMPQI